MHNVCVISLFYKFHYQHRGATDILHTEGLFFSLADSVAPSTLWLSTLTCPSHLRCVLYCSLQVKLIKYICKQLQCKQKVPETERPEALDSYPHLRDWLRTINLRPELIEVGHVAVWECQCVMLSLSRVTVFVSLMCVFTPHAHVCMWNTWLVIIKMPLWKKQGRSHFWSYAKQWQLFWTWTDIRKKKKALYHETT